MNKTELIDLLAQNLNRKKEAAALGSLLEAITMGLKCGDKITLTGFGTFKVAKRKARTGHTTRAPAKPSRSRPPRAPNSLLARA